MYERVNNKQVDDDDDDLLSNFTMGSDWIMDPILQLVERSSGIIDPTLGFMDNGLVCH